MKAALSRALMRLAAATLGEKRRDWAAAMGAEFEAAADEGRGLSFAAGCFVAAWRDALRREEGQFLLTTYAMALCLLIPMAGVQIGCAVLGLPYLYPPGYNVPVLLWEGGRHEVLLRATYLNGVPSFTVLLLVLGAGNLRLAWAMLDRDWSRVMRTGTLMFAAAMTLVIVMSVFFLDSSRALLQGAVLTVELATIAMMARWHAQLSPEAPAEHPG